VAGTEPRLGSGFLGGQLRKGGLHQPPFSFRPVALALFFVVAGRVRDFSRECVIEVVQFGGPDPLGPSFSFAGAVLVFNLLVEARHGVPVPAFDPSHSSKPRPRPSRCPNVCDGSAPRCKTDRRAQDAYTLPNFELSTVDCELHLKKMSGRWGDRPLGRGGLRVLQPEASSQLPPVRLRSRAAERDTGAIRPKPFRSGSRNQLPITFTILLPTTVRVDSPAGSFFSVLPTVLCRLLLVPMYFRKFFAPPVRIECSPLRSSA
jgi:hypothetical protein